MALTDEIPGLTDVLEATDVNKAARQIHLLNMSPVKTDEIRRINFELNRMGHTVRQLLFVEDEHITRVRELIGAIIENTHNNQDVKELGKLLDE